MSDVPSLPQSEYHPTTGVANLAEILEAARRDAAILQDLLETARKAAASATDSQAQSVEAMAEIQKNLTEATTISDKITAIKTQISDGQEAITEATKVFQTAMTDMEAKAASALAQAQAKLLEVTTASEQDAIAAKTRTTDLQTVITTKSEHIEGAKTHVDRVRSELDAKLVEATQKVTEAEGLRARAQTAADNAATLLSELRTTKGGADADATAVADAKRLAEESATVAKGLADKAATVDQRVTDYEQKHADFERTCAALLSKSEEILRGSTAVGLAAAFDGRRQMFLRPHTGWQKVFFWALVVIVAVGISGIIQFIWFTPTQTYTDLGLVWLSRLPIAGALVWLAIHASREAALAKRLEEDYGYKAAMATCFEGFREEMGKIERDVPGDSPLAKLCQDTLMTIAMPPGRIYDKHDLVVSLVDEMRKIVKAATEVTKGASEAAKPVVEAVTKAVKPAG